VKIKTFYKSQKLDKLDPSHKNSAIAEFNIKLSNNEAPQPLIENPSNYQNELTMIAKRR